MTRLEYRVFGDDLKHRGGDLARLMEQTSHDTREDRYLLGPPDSHIFKLRGTSLDLKYLVRCDDGYEEWDAAGCCTLPETGSVLQKAFGRETGLPDLDPDREYDASAIAEAFGNEGFRSARIRKERTRFAKGECLAEITKVTLDAGAQTYTVAIEGTERKTLDRLREAFGMKDRPNVSYPAWLGVEVRPISG